MNFERNAKVSRLVHLDNIQLSRNGKNSLGLVFALSGAKNNGILPGIDDIRFFVPS